MNKQVLDIAALRSGAWQIVRNKESVPDEVLVDSIVALTLNFIDVELERQPTQEPTNG